MGFVEKDQVRDHPYIYIYIKVQAIPEDIERKIQTNLMHIYRYIGMKKSGIIG